MSKSNYSEKGGTRTKGMTPTGGAGGKKGTFSGLVNSQPRQGVPDFMKGKAK